jgi:hypothetical protein
VIAINQSKPKEIGIQAQPQSVSRKVQTQSNSNTIRAAASQISNRPPCATADGSTQTNDFSSRWQDTATTDTVDLDAIDNDDDDKDADNDDEASNMSDTTYCPSDKEGGSNSECDNDDNSNAKTTVHVCLAYTDNIHQLFKFCPSCGSPVLPNSYSQRFEGTMMCVKVSCLNGCDFSWNSQPTLSTKKANRSGLGDVELATSIVLCGGTFALFHSLSKCMKLGMFSHTKYSEIQSTLVAPVIFSAWNAQRIILLQELRDRPGPVRLCGDGRSDSPGYSAKYCTYTTMDVDKNNVVTGRNLQLGQESASSVGMEVVGLESCLDEYDEYDIKIAVITTDRSPSVMGLMQTRYPSIDHQHDLWHIGKSIKKKLVATSKKKGMACIADWIRSIINHLYFSAQNCMEDPDLLIELWLSILKHIVGKHSWNADKVHKTVLRCSHDDVDSQMRDAGQEKAYLEEDSAAFKAVAAIISAPLLLSALRRCTLALPTDSLENLHSVMLKYMPKRLHFGYTSMNARCCLAYMDHNFNAQRATNTDMYKFQYSRVSGQWVARRVYVAKDYSWRQDLLENVLQMYRTGISPPDCEVGHTTTFHDLKTLHHFQCQARMICLHQVLQILDTSVR